MVGWGDEKVRGVEVGGDGGCGDGGEEGTTAGGNGWASAAVKRKDSGFSEMAALGGKECC